MKIQRFSKLRSKNTRGCVQGTQPVGGVETRDLPGASSLSPKNNERCPHTHTVDKTCMGGMVAATCVACGVCVGETEFVSGRGGEATHLVWQRTPHVEEHSSMCSTPLATSVVLPSSVVVQDEGRKALRTRRVTHCFEFRFENLYISTRNFENRCIFIQNCLKTVENRFENRCIFTYGFENRNFLKEKRISFSF